MSNPIANRPPARAPQAQAQTHLIGCSRTPKFRRSDLDFKAEWQSWPLAELRALWGDAFDAKLEAIKNEPMLMASVVTEAEAAQKAKPARAIETVESENAQLRSQLAALEQRLAALEAPKG